jgi:hypothetical protein
VDTSALPVDGQKSEQIAIDDAHHAVDPVHREGTAGHPPANCPVGDIQGRRDVADREKPRSSGESWNRVLPAEFSFHVKDLLCRQSCVCIAGLGRGK